jgi:hypothetical protein
MSEAKKTDLVFGSPKAKYKLGEHVYFRYDPKELPKAIKQGVIVEVFYMGNQWKYSVEMRNLDSENDTYVSEGAKDKCYFIFMDLPEEQIAKL